MVEKEVSFSSFPRAEIPTKNKSFFFTCPANEKLKTKKKIAYGLGVGRPQEGRPRWESDQTELAIGAGNGSNLATDLTLEKHPRTGKPFRKIKIVDITKDAGKIIKDPYGKGHVIPEKAEIKINTIRDRKINIIEIK